MQYQVVLLPLCQRVGPSAHGRFSQQPSAGVVATKLRLEQRRPNVFAYVQLLRSFLRANSIRKWDQSSIDKCTRPAGPSDGELSILNRFMFYPGLATEQTARRHQRPAHPRHDQTRFLEIRLCLDQPLDRSARNSPLGIFNGLKQSLRDQIFPALFAQSSRRYDLAMRSPDSSRETSSTWADSFELVGAASRVELE